MKLHATIIVFLLSILVCGCQEQADKNPNKGLVNRRLINSYNDVAMQNAIVSQHTLYPYHFVANGKELNDLGQKDLDALISHYLKYPGRINIRRQNTAANLYEERVKVVHERLREAGVEMKRVRISDSMPGGSGMTSEKIITVLEKESKQVSAPTISN